MVLLCRRIAFYGLMKYSRHLWLLQYGKVVLQGSTHLHINCMSFFILGYMNPLPQEVVVAVLIVMVVMLVVVLLLLHRLVGGTLVFYLLSALPRSKCPLGASSRDFEI